MYADSPPAPCDGESDGVATPSDGPPRELRCVTVGRGVRSSSASRWVGNGLPSGGKVSRKLMSSSAVEALRSKAEVHSHRPYHAAGEALEFAFKVLCVGRRIGSRDELAICNGVQDLACDARRGSLRASRRPSFPPHHQQPLPPRDVFGNGQSRRGYMGYKSLRSTTIFSSS